MSFVCPTHGPYTPLNTGTSAAICPACQGDGRITSDRAFVAVEEALCRILADRHPGTSWVSTHRASAGPLTGQVARLTLPDEPDDTAPPPARELPWLDATTEEGAA